VYNLNESPEFNVTEINLEKYDKMIFNPLRFDCNSINNKYNDVVTEIDDATHDCKYMTPDQFCSESSGSSGKLNFLNVNIRSLSKNFDKLKECLQTTNCNFSVIGISETHLREKPSDYYNINGYKVEYTNRIGREKGGVCLYVSDKLKYKVRKDLSHANENYESCFIEIESHSHKNIIVGAVYRAHTSIDEFIVDIDPVFKKLNNEKKHLYVMGDFNIDLLKVDSHRPTHDYLDLIYSYSLIPTIFKPTRITETTATIIDNILTNNLNIVQSSILVTDISDHLPTVLSTNLDGNNLTTNQKSAKYKRYHNTNNVTNFQKRLSEVNWQEKLDNVDANVDYNKFIEIFDILYNECIPLKKVSSNKKKEPMSPWISKGLLNSINMKNKMYKQYLQSPSEAKFQKFKTYKNKLHMLIRKSKRKYFFTKFERTKNNLRQTWRTINDIIGKTKNNSVHSKFKDESGNMLSDPKDISNKFNTFFVNIGPKLASNINNTGKKYFDYLLTANTGCMFMKPIVEMEIIKIIDKFNQNKSAGNDNIGNYIIKRVGNEIVKPLAMIFNLSISTGIVPEKMKIAKVIPIYIKREMLMFFLITDQSHAFHAFP